MSLDHEEVVYPILFEEPILRSNVSPHSELFSIISTKGEGWIGVHSNSMETKNYQQIVEAYFSSNNSIFETKEQVIQLKEENQEIKKENTELKEQAITKKKKMDVLFAEFEAFKKEQTLLKTQVSEIQQENTLLKNQVSEMITKKELREEIHQFKKDHVAEEETLKKTISGKEKEINRKRKMVIKMIPYYCEHMVSSSGNLFKKLEEKVGLDYFTNQSISEGNHLSAPITFEEYKSFQKFTDTLYDERNAICHRLILYEDLIKDVDIVDICKRLMVKYSTLTNPVPCSILNSLIEKTFNDFQNDNFKL